MKKILLVTILIVGTLLFTNYSFKVKATTEQGNLVEQIETFSALEEDNQIKIKRIEREFSFNKDNQVILFIGEEEGLGYAILNKGKPISVVFGDIKQGYDQYKNYFIAYGEKPDEKFSKLNLLINTSNEEIDIEKSIDLEQGRYYLVVQELPGDIKGSRVLMGNYIFN